MSKGFSIIRSSRLLRFTNLLVIVALSSSTLLPTSALAAEKNYAALSNNQKESPFTRLPEPSLKHASAQIQTELAEDYALYIPFVRSEPADLKSTPKLFEKDRISAGLAKSNSIQLLAKSAISKPSILSLTHQVEKLREPDNSLTIQNSASSQAANFLEPQPQNRSDIPLGIEQVVTGPATLFNAQPSAPSAIPITVTISRSGGDAVLSWLHDPSFTSYSSLVLHRPLLPARRPRRLPALHPAASRLRQHPGLHRHRRHLGYFHQLILPHPRSRCALRHLALQHHRRVRCLHLPRLEPALLAAHPHHHHPGWRSRRPAHRHRRPHHR